jgi:putative redox protein
MEMYAKRKGWDIGPVEVQCEYSPAERGCVTNFKIILRLPSGCTQEQVDRLRIIAAKCPVHRTLDGEVHFDERIELVEPAAAAY